MINLLAICLLIISCGKLLEPAKKPQITMLDKLRIRYEENLSKLVGWPSRTDCDAMLFAGEAKASGVTGINLNEARDANGKLYRRPSQDCYRTGSSRSNFSNDMLAGYLLASPRADILRYISYLKANDYNMGEGDLGAVLVKPNMLGVLGRTVGVALAPRIPYLKSNKDYVRHIQTLMIYIDGRSTGYLTEHEFKLLKSYNDNKDYLIMAVIAKYDGSYDKPTSLLLKEPKPPSYVRGDEPERYRLAHWLFAASIVLGD